MYEAVFDCDALTVYNVDSVRIIPPLTKNVDRIDFHVKAVKKIHTPDGGIHKSDSFYANVSAIIQLHVSVCVRFIAMLGKSLLAAIVEQSVSVKMQP